MGLLKGPPLHSAGVRLSHPAQRQKWKDTVKAKGFICADGNDGCYPGDWYAMASTALAWDTKSPSRDSLSFLEFLSDEGE